MEARALLLLLVAFDDLDPPPEVLVHLLHERARVGRISPDEFEPWQWGTYRPTWVDYGILLGSFGWFFMWFLLFIKQLPVMAMAEIKEVLLPRLKHEYDHSHDLPEGIAFPDEYPLRMVLRLQVQKQFPVQLFPRAAAEFSSDKFR